jgi:hypothetical protein
MPGSGPVVAAMSLNDRSGPGPSVAGVRHSTRALWEAELAWVAACRSRATLESYRHAISKFDPGLPDHWATLLHATLRARLERPPARTRRRHIRLAVVGAQVR